LAKTLFKNVFKNVFKIVFTDREQAVGPNVEEQAAAAAGHFLLFSLLPLYANSMLKSAAAIWLPFFGKFLDYFGLCCFYVFWR
jgi:hypothetical protein